MGEIGAHDDHGLGAAPQQVEHARDVVSIGAPYGERNDTRARRDALEERELDLERVLASMRRFSDLVAPRLR